MKFDKASLVDGAMRGLTLPAKQATSDKIPNGLAIVNQSFRLGKNDSWNAIRTHNPLHPLGPGPVEPIGAALGNYYYGSPAQGEVPTYEEVRSASGVSGTNHSNLNGWWKVQYDGKILFISVAPIALDTTFEYLYGKGVVGGYGPYGKNDEGQLPYPNAVLQNKEVEKNKYRYRIRLLTEAEWDLIIPRLHGEGWANWSKTQTRVGNSSGVTWTSDFYLIDGYQHGTGTMVRVSTTSTRATSNATGRGENFAIGPTAWRVALEMIV